MKKYILLTMLIIISCTKKVEEKRNIIPFKNKVFPLQNIDSVMVVSLDTVKTLKKLIDVASVKCKNDEDYFLRYDNKDVRVYIPYTKCNKMVCRLIKESNIIGITDSIHSNRSCLKFSISNYKKVLQKQFLNRGKNPFLSHKPDRVVTLFLLNREKFITNYELNIISEGYISFLKEFNLNNIDSLKKVYPLQLSFSYPITLPPIE